MKVLNDTCPGWRSMAIHESSPSGGGASDKIAKDCARYTTSQYLPEIGFGNRNRDGVYSQDLENQTFPDEMFDIVVTQDVFEHVFHPDRAIAEIVRTLKPGGAHIMSVPIVRKSEPSRRRASIDGDEVRHMLPPEYHGNPVGDGAALVTIDWGYDIAGYLGRASGCSTTIHTIDDARQGITAEYIDIVVTRKAGRIPVL